MRVFDPIHSNAVHGACNVQRCESEKVYSFLGFFVPYFDRDVTLLPTPPCTFSSAPPTAVLLCYNLPGPELLSRAGTSHLGNLARGLLELAPPSAVARCVLQTNLSASSPQSHQNCLLRMISPRRPSPRKNHHHPPSNPIQSKRTYVPSPGM